MNTPTSLDAADQARAIKAIQETNGPLYVKESVKHEEADSGARVSVLSYNILADAYVKYFYLSINRKLLNFDYRSKIIIEEIKKFNTDVICLQEVDRYEDFYKAQLEEIGYELIYQQKNGRDDGCVVGFKKEKYEMVEACSLNLNKGHKYHRDPDFIRGNIAVVVTLRQKSTEKVINVVNTHLFWDPSFEQVRFLQMAEIMRYINETFKENDALIWTGDFNSKPGSNTIRYLEDRSAPAMEFMNMKSREKLSTMKNIYRNLHKCEVPKIDFGSAYSQYGSLLNDDSSTYPKFTNYTENHKKTIDYVFYTKKNLTVKNLMKLPTQEQIKDNALPNWRYPSDHLPLIVDFELNEIQEQQYVDIC